MALIPVYVLGGRRKDELLSFLASLTLAPQVTAETLKACGFANFSPRYLVYHQRLHEPDDYPASFSLVLRKRDLSIKEWNLLDENFLQPYFCNEHELAEIQRILKPLLEQNLLVRKEPSCLLPKPYKKRI